MVHWVCRPTASQRAKFGAWTWQKQPSPPITQQSRAPPLLMTILSSQYAFFFLLLFFNNRRGGAPLRVSIRGDFHFRDRFYEIWPPGTHSVRSGVMIRAPLPYRVRGEFPAPAVIASDRELGAIDDGDALSPPPGNGERIRSHGPFRPGPLL